MIRFAMAVLLTVAVAAPLAGCGRKGPPEPPKKEKVEYPRKYPKEK